jgi:hypothetical protein
MRAAVAAVSTAPRTPRRHVRWSATSARLAAALQNRELRDSAWIRDGLTARGGQLLDE